MLKHVLGHVAAVVRQAAQDANDAGATPVWVCDGTFGAGGYTRAILKAFPNVRVVAIDQDPLVIRLATTMARKFPGRLFPEYGSFRHLDRIVAKHAPQGCHAIVLDIGVSSMQIDTASRGFSYRKDGPLDMRMDRELPALSAVSASGPAIDNASSPGEASREASTIAGDAGAKPKPRRGRPRPSTDRSAQDPNHEPSSSSSTETRSSPSPAKSVLYYAGHKPLCTAADLVRYLPESRLAALFRVWGQEPFAGRIARHLAEARETRSYRGSGRDRFCATTRELAIRIARAVGFGVSKRERVEDAQQAARGKKHRGGGAPRPREDRFGQDPAQDAAIWRALGTLRTSRHPCRRVFQALRIAVNDELGSLRDAAAAAARPGVLVPGGRLVVVTFQPLEDKVVKQELLRAAGDARVCRALGDLSRPPDLT
ncbi:S-adenosyl-L-methionine-dependent methyltransferase, partial [Caulochytrium protostelioides]